MASMQLRQTDLAYFAGLMDGEGSIHITPCYHWTYQGRGAEKYHRFIPAISMTNTDKAMLDWVAAHFGGKVTRVKRARNKLTKWKQTYYWRISHVKAATVLIAIRPYILTKRKQLDLYLQFMQTNHRCGRKGTPVRVLKKRAKITAQMKQLNRRGPPEL